MSNNKKNWASGLKDGTPVYAPADKLVINGQIIFNPQNVHYRIAGFMPVVDVQPAEPAPVGYHWSPVKWEVQVLQIVRL